MPILNSGRRTDMIIKNISLKTDLPASEHGLFINFYEAVGY
jgi:hypothetical protein